MISICIPVYNTAVYNLVHTLVRQLEEADTAWEIIVADDASTNEDCKIANSALKDLPGVHYFLFDVNQGRSGTRNFLAKHAQYPWLVFLDADSELVSNLFIKNYLAAIGTEKQVLIGGRICGEMPKPCNKRLHWAYCCYREATKSHNIGFASNNFCISRALMLQTPFNVKLSGWGHEDTDLGLRLREESVEMVYIDNPVLHTQLEDATIFISKSEESMYNLVLLQKQFADKALAKQVKLFDWYLKAKRWHLLHLISFIWKHSKIQMLRQLSGCAPSLRLFDFYRLGYFISIRK